MAKLTHQSNFNTASFGQYGSTFLSNSTNNLEPPTGKVFIAVTMLTNVNFDTLDAVDPGATSGSFGTNVDTATGDYDGKGNTLTNSTTFPKGLTIYGEWDKINIGSSQQIVAYWGPAN